ncbi:fructose-bisphosphatase class III [Streptococcus devriesei]|uniref:fructose-bisphosphatase class III n=1 Tax=Streptococcus devriesei TaxID=231233 RepID=UPI0004155BC6|nr:fructose-bisphosphatase class III [Streptococcus devriesei]
MKAFYQLLKEKFPTRADILTEIINLEAICHLPKGTEHFVSDLHGEYPAFDYILRTCSGSIKSKIQECFDLYQLSAINAQEFCLFVYYPEQKIAFDKEDLSHDALQEKLIALLPIQIQVLKYLGNKYTRSKVRKSLPANFAYIIEELLAEIERNPDKESYFDAIIDKITELNQLEELVIALSYVIQRLAVDVLHVVGDIYDRGKYPDIILDRLEKLPNVDIQWGNHDITWMGAVSGSYVCMINVIRIAARYNNLTLIEDRYGINLRKLVDYSRKYYQPVAAFDPILDEGRLSQEDSDLLNLVRQAAAILQFKLESRLIHRRPDFQLEHRQVLDMIDYANKTICLNGKTYALSDFNSSRIVPDKPYALDAEEEKLLQQLMHAFQTSEGLKRHVDFLFEKGSMYLQYNGNLLFHGCIPLHENGDFKSLKIKDSSYSGKALLDFYEKEIRQSYRHPNKHEDFSTDLFWYLWIGENSSLFGKKAMTTFERYFIEDKATHEEIKNPYYRLRNKESVCRDILKEFGLNEEGHIINGHTPVKEKDGENPVKAGGKMLVIDGGFAKAYQKKTGLAGYTLVFNSYGMLLVAHQPFTNSQDVLMGKYDILSTRRLVEESSRRILVKDTNIGHRICDEIKHLEYLYQHFDKY